jgi:hypothetical protein
MKKLQYNIKEKKRETTLWFLILMQEATYLETCNLLLFSWTLQFCATAWRHHPHVKKIFWTMSIKHFVPINYDHYTSSILDMFANY